MQVLVVNAGSSSLKSQLIETESRVVSMKCLAEKVGTPEAFMNVSFAPAFEKTTYDIAGLSVAECLAKLLDILVEDPNSPLERLDQIDAIGNRVVAGGEYFTKSVIVDKKAREELTYCEELAPLHNPGADACIDMMRVLLPDTPQVVVFDTAFHASMPPKSYLYPLPMRYYEKYKIRRYGAHGTSHRYAAQSAAQLLGRPLEELGIITCHLGNGCSITAVDKGKSVDTSMGFTPLDGLMMGTRSGSLDPAILTYIMRREDMSFDDMDNLLNRESGILGISGVSSDMRDVQAAADAGNKNAQLALDMYAYRVQKTIGSFYAIMKRTDAVVMTAGIGENSVEMRELIFSGLTHLGMVIDKDRNSATEGVSSNRIISVDDSPVTLCIVATDEEMRIAEETAEIVSRV